MERSGLYSMRSGINLACRVDAAQNVLYRLRKPIRNDVLIAHTVLKYGLRKLILIPNTK